jgi:Na+/melibiose symporter-like transporter
MPQKRKSFNYAIGMFGTSIPINMLKTFAFTFYVLGLGVTTKQWAAMLLIYTFIDAIDNPVYGFLSDRTRCFSSLSTPFRLSCRAMPSLPTACSFTS